MPDGRDNARGFCKKKMEKKIRSWVLILILRLGASSSYDVIIGTCPADCPLLSSWKLELGETSPYYTKVIFFCCTFGHFAAFYSQFFYVATIKSFYIFLQHKKKFSPSALCAVLRREVDYVDLRN